MRKLFILKAIKHTNKKNLKNYEQLGHLQFRSGEFCNKNK